MMLNIPPSICYVDRVIDGDTISYGKLKVRLCGIDAPERKQTFGRAATTFLTKLVLNKNVQVIVSNDRDFYGRILAEVWIGDRLINGEMISSGMAYSYGSCPIQKESLETAEQTAKDLKLGIWKRDNLRPWDFRFKQRNNQNTN